jgi:hypothetical protein
VEAQSATEGDAQLLKDGTLPGDRGAARPRDAFHRHGAAPQLDAAHPAGAGRRSGVLPMSYAGTAHGVE